MDEPTIFVGVTRTKLLLVGAALAASALLLAQTDPSSVTYVVHDKVMEALSKGGTLATGSDFRVAGAQRDKPGLPEAHDKETEIVLIMDGEATYVTGGTLSGSKESQPGERKGNGIEGGQTRHLTKGDVIVLPPGTPHWFKEVPARISYYDVKVHKQGR